MAIKNTISVIKNGKEISKTNPARARMLIKKGRAVPIFIGKNFSIKLNEKGERMNFIAYKNEVVNLDKVERIELKDKKIMFFMDAIAARTNWEFENHEEAKKAFNKIIKTSSAYQVTNE